MTASSRESGPQLQIRGAACVATAKSVEQASSHRLQMTHFSGQNANPWKVIAQ